MNTKIMGGFGMGIEVEIEDFDIDTDIFTLSRTNWEMELGIQVGS